MGRRLQPGIGPIFEFLTVKSIGAQDNMSREDRSRPTRQPAGESLSTGNHSAADTIALLPDEQVDSDVTHSTPASPTRSRWVAPAALVIAVFAIGIAVWSLVRLPGESDNVQQSAVDNARLSPDDAKARACVAFDTVRKAVSMQTNADLGPDPVAREAVAANARLATLAGGEYLLSRLDPGLPLELADALRSFANNLQDVGMYQLAGVPNTDPILTAKMSDAQSASQQLTDMCK
jgi:hypothetical protein